MVRVEGVQGRVHPLDLGRELVGDPLQEIDPVGDRAPRIIAGEGLSSRRLECPEDIALPTSAIVDLLLGPLGGAFGRIHWRWPANDLADSGPISSTQITTLPAGGSL